MAFMTEPSHAFPGDKVLEIGTGSGWLCSEKIPRVLVDQHAEGGEMEDGR